MEYAERPTVGGSRINWLEISMSHFWGAGIGALRDEGNPQNLVAVIADDFQGILIGVFNFFFFFPKQLATFRAFANEHRHRDSSI